MLRIPVVDLVVDLAAWSAGSIKDLQFKGCVSAPSLRYRQYYGGIGEGWTGPRKGYLGT